MSPTPKEILKKYWGYDSFRPLQEEIVNSVLAGEDTLALLPTGGGKSICFQVPALCLDGSCLVVTPLVALMTDQVQNLLRRGIQAAAIHAGMHPREIRLTYEKCMEGRLKFLYLSPERLDSLSFREVAPYLRPALIAIDEAHCISQWGYDFRPPYLRIASVREIYPDIPVIALTATAVDKVVQDIQEKLLFRSENVLRKSFKRENLAYVAYKEEDKYRKLLNICNGVRGTGIVYVRNRRLTRETSEFLIHHKIKATYYHAGLEPSVREKVQQDWIDEKTRVIVATNAFGMGIDKPNVRFVVHMDLPDNLESYFQEAGRAGRDGLKSFAVLLFNESDLKDARYYLEQNWPEPSGIRQVYQALGNYFQLATGSGRDMTFDFELDAFAANYKLNPVSVYAVLKILERDGYIALSDAVNTPSRVLMRIDKNELYKFQVENREADSLIKVMLRSYSGLFTDFTKIDEYEIARRLSMNHDHVVRQLKSLASAGVLDYLPKSQSPQLTFLTERMDPRDIELSKTFYFDRKKDAAARLEKLISYVSMHEGCRSRRLLEYFDDRSGDDCGICDLCIGRRKKGTSARTYEILKQRIIFELQSQPVRLQELIMKMEVEDEKEVLNIIRLMIDQGELVRSDDLLSLK
jgi:ATP-dependent DNA helicase RecQ